MVRLISKIQYKNFEPGEFVDVQMRHYEEVIDLIEKFPWDTQRDKLIIDLTNPSITIEGKNNDYLKLSLFYNNKFVLRYFDQPGNLYTKTFLHFKDGYSYIKNYFEKPQFDITDFKKEITWLQKNLKHFVTQDFRYIVTPRSTRKYLLMTSGISFCFTIALLILGLMKGLNSIDVTLLIIGLLLIFLIGGGLNLIVFFNYYTHVKDKILILSKGNDDFYFGNMANPAKYNKQDILQYTTIKIRGSRNPLNAFAIVEVAFKDGRLLKIPNLLVDHSAMEEKLYQYLKIEKNSLPIM